MATRKKARWTWRTVRHVCAEIAHATRMGYDTTPMIYDPETVGVFECALLTRDLTKRLVAASGRGTSPHAELIREFVWDPVARCIVRAMVRMLCAEADASGAPHFPLWRIAEIAERAVTSARERLRAVESAAHGQLGVEITDERFPTLVRLTTSAFMHPRRFPSSAQFTYRGIQYTVRRGDKELIVMTGGA